MKIKQALKQKNKIAKKISEHGVRLQKYNSVEEGAIRPYDMDDELTHLMNQVDDMVELKTKIHKANIQVYDQIFRLSELKNLVRTIRSIDCTEGLNSIASRWGDSKSTTMTSVISQSRKDNLIEMLEHQIDEIQDFLDTHNATTEL
jgi:hypothetical protein